jgi:hypothetical protein
MKNTMRRPIFLTIVAIASALQLGCAYRVAEHGMVATAKPDMAPCASNLDCHVPVYVSVGAAGECNVHLLFGKVTVAKVFRPKVIWLIEKAQPLTDNYLYRFDPAVGIDILNNVRATDFDEPGFDSGIDRRFKWVSRNLRFSDHDYTVSVQRRATATDPWSACTLLDPKIVNDGP